MTFEQIMANEKFVLNDEQISVVNSTVNTVVSAGAGAGKTAVLSWRFLRLVMEKDVSPEQILTLTFTKKAASEMRDRIYRRLLLAKDSLKPGILEKFGMATISTLDSFCLQIVKGDSISYGLPRDIANLSDNDLRSLVERLSVKFLNDSANLEIRNAIASLVLPDDLMDRFFMLIAQKATLAGDYNADRVYDEFRAKIRRLYESQRNELINQFDRLGQLKMTPKFQQQYDNLLGKLEAESFGESDYFSLQGIRDENIKDIVNEGIRPILGKDTGFVSLQNLAKSPEGETPLLQVAVERFADLLNQEKRRLGSLTFSDISDLSVAVLRDNLELRNKFKERFRYIMIDEFQDNNSKQRDLLFLLAEKLDIPGVAGRVPTVDELEPEKLFFVGDEKQSIYKFRGADVSVFRNLQQEIGQKGNNLTMSMNYRSQAALIDHFNSVFAKVLEDSSHAFDAEFVAIGSKRDPDCTKSRIIFAAYDKGNIDDDDIEDSGSLEAEVIGDFCKQILETDEFLVDGKRPHPEDIAILFGAASNQMNIEKALKRRNLGYQIAETRSLMLDAVASDFYNYINCILYPEDRRSWIALLKSPFCGLCEQSIRNVVVEGSEVLAIDKTRYELFRTLFEDVKQRAFRLTIAQLLETLYIDCGYKAYLDADDDSRAFLEHYEYLYSYALDYDSEGRGLADFAKFLRDKLGSSEKLPEATVLHRELSGIQIMTVHKSKGLEFKVVIYCGIGTAPRNESSDYVFQYDGNLISTEQKNILKVLEDDRKLKEEAEKRRVMYVAMTRARDHLIMVGGFKRTNNGISSGKVFEWYSNAVGADFDETGNYTAKDPAVEMRNVSSTSHAESVHTRQLPVAPQPDALEFESHPDRVSVTDLKHHSEKLEPCPALPSCDADALVNAKGIHDRFGTLCHYVLECLMGKGSYADVECSISDNEKENQLLLDQAKVFADGFKASDFYRTHIDGRQTEEELRFYTSDEKGDVAIEGVIDLLVFGEDYNLVVDYKTDSLRNPMEHKIQVQTYVKVAEELYGKKCYGTLFYLRDSSISEVWNRNGEEVDLI